jgi:NAD+ synthase (glutamine-hydrolysing)
MKAFLAQINPIVGDLRTNFEKHVDIINIVNSKKDSNPKLIIFPELSLIGYPARDLLFKKELLIRQGDYLKQLSELCPANLGILVGGVSSNDTTGKELFNSVFFITWNKVADVFRKTLLPNYDVFDETRYFESNKEFKTLDFGGYKLGISICEDLWADELKNLYDIDPIAKLTNLGAKLIINCSASPYYINKIKLRQSLITHAAEKHQVPILYCNQVGSNDHLVFDGASLVVNKHGYVTRQGRSFIEDLMEIDLEALLKNDEKAFNDSPDLNIDEENNAELFISDIKAYGEILSALKLGIQDYFKKCGFKKAILGLSGGIDSALVAYLAVQALGKENVSGIMLASKFTSNESLKDAQQLAKNLGIDYRSISIKELHETMLETVPKISKLANENVQARLRANILLAISNTENSLLLATSNKSELAVGYATIYGDTCGSIAPIGDLLKTEVYALVDYINQNTISLDVGLTIPDNICKKAPTAELRENQKDEDSLPPYSKLDAIIMNYVEKRKSLTEIVELGFYEPTVLSILGMIDKNEYKRQQYPPIIKVKELTFGYGRKMPIAAKYEHY